MLVRIPSFSYSVKNNYSILDFSVDNYFETLYLDSARTLVFLMANFFSSAHLKES